MPHHILTAVASDLVFFNLPDAHDNIVSAGAKLPSDLMIIALPARVNI